MHSTRWTKRRGLILAAALSLGALAAFGHARHASQSQTTSRTAQPEPAPVRVATVEKRDFKVVLHGLGTVQPVNSVVVRSRVDGQIVTVNFKEGQPVHKGDLLVQIDPAPYKASLDQAQAKLLQDQATLRNAELDLQRTQTLAAHGNATQQLLDQRVAAVAQTKALIEADKAAIQSAQVQLAYTTIRSPLDGRAGFRTIDPGNIVHATDQGGILTITQLEPIAVLFTAPEQNLPQISGALKQGPLAVTALSSDGKQRLADGKLTLLDNQVDAASGTIRMKGIFDNPEHTLWPGLSVQTDLLVETLRDKIVVPDTALQRGPEGLYAFLVGPDDKALLRKLEVARIENGEALVTSGLTPGDCIVTAGHYRVLPGHPLRILDDSKPNDVSASRNSGIE